MLRLGRGHSLRESGLFSFENLSTELVLAALGVLVAFAWTINPALIPFAVAPLLLDPALARRAPARAGGPARPEDRPLQRPSLQLRAEREARASLRTGRAARSADDRSRPPARDQQHLRPPRRRRGPGTHRRRLPHNLRADDIAARFGGEEFVLLLPDTEFADAVALAERIRETIGKQRVTVGAIGETVSATVSIGIAMYPRDGTRSEHAHPPRRPCRLPGQDPGAQPRRRRRRRAARRAPAELGVVGAEARRAGRPGHAAGVATWRDARTGERRRGRRRARSCRPRRRAQGGAPREPADRSRRGRYLPRPSVGSGRTSLVGGARRRRAGARAPGRSGRDLGRRCRRAGGCRADRQLGCRRARARGSGDRRGRPSAARLHVDLQPGRADGGRSRRCVRLRSRARQRGDAESPSSWALPPAPSTSPSTRPAQRRDRARGRHRPRWLVWKQNYAWLLPHYLAYGLVASVVAIAYEQVHVYALAVFLVPLVLMRATQAGQLRASRESEARLQDAANTIHRQNVSLEDANRLLRNRSTEALEGLCATVDARDAYTAGHSRRVREIAVRIGSEIGLSRDELEISPTRRCSTTSARSPFPMRS